MTNRRIIRAGAFTIVELIVAMGITVIMLFLINQMFTVTSNAVSLGISLSDVIGAGRAMSDQIERDALAMNKPEDGALGPTGGKGLMVIVLQKQSNVAYLEPGYKESTRSVYSCQLGMLIRRDVGTNKTGLMPVAPANSTTFSVPDLTPMANVEAVWVWYGHLQKVDGTGVDNGTLVPPTGLNRVCNNWLLGRQATFLVATAADLDTPSPVIARAAGVWNNAVVTGITHPNIGSPLRYHGLTDIALCSLNSPTAPAALLGGDVASNPPGSPNTLYAFNGPDRFDNATYQARAIACMYESQRLRANPLPAVIDKANPFPPGQIAQMHPILTDNVSDFIIDVAGDYEDDGALSINADGEDGTVDLHNGEIKWYGLEANTVTGTFAFPTSMPPWIANASTTTDMSPKSAALANGGIALVFRHDFPKHWPYLVRIRYRIHDKRGDLLGDRSPENDGSPLVTAETAPGAVGKTNVGRWFEQIIHVKRE